MRGVWHHQDRRRRGPRELTGIVDHSREGSSHGKVEWTWSLKVRRRVPELAAERGEDFRSGVRIGGWIPFQGQQERHRLACSKDATSVPGACHIVTLAGDAPGEVSRHVQQDTTGHRGRKGDPLYQIRLLLRSSHTQAHPASTRTTP